MRQAPCPHFRDAFSDFVDDRLAPERRMELQAHLDSCEACLRHLAAYRRGVMVYRALDAEGNETIEPGALFQAVERRLWLEGHLGPREDAAHPVARPLARFGRRALGVAAAAALAFVLIRPPAPGDPGPSDSTTAVVQAGVAASSGAPVRVASVPIEIPDDLDRARPDRGRAERVAPRRSTRDAPVRLASVGSTDPAADVAFEQRLADVQARLRRMTWETPVSVTDGWNRPRIGSAPVVRAVATTPTGFAPRPGSTPAPWGVEAALVVP